MMAEQPSNGAPSGGYGSPSSGGGGGWSGGRTAADSTPSDADFDRGSDGASSSGRPANPDAYQLALPADFELPAGAEVKFDPTDAVRAPVIKEARALAHELGIDQKNFSRMLGLHAKLELAQLRAEREYVDREQRSIENFSQRQAAILKNLDAHLSKEHADTIRSIISSKKAFEALEALLAASGRSLTTPAQRQSRAMARRWYGSKAMKG
jgi:hypothetical protein